MPVVLAIAGSPRRHGNSETLLDAFVDGVRAAGGTADKLAVVEYDITPCNGCGSCVATGECVIADRMTGIYPRIDAADAVVIASPVFFATVPAVLKALYDRCQPYWARRWVLGEPAPARKRPGAFLVARAGGDPYGYSAAVTTTRSLFAVLGVDYSAEVAVEDVDEADAVKGRPDALETARRAGERLVSAV